MNDYTRIERTIRYLDEHYSKQPTLPELAQAAGLSTSHFHRLFRRWAGVSPKDFLQCLTLEHAKHRLRASESVLDASLGAGLSGPGRLHDLLVTLEAASPGEYKRAGEGMHIEWGYANSPFGSASIGWNERGICHLAFHDAVDENTPPSELHRHWPHATLSHNARQAKTRAEEIFQPRESRSTALAAFVRATPFQLKVWRALLCIPEGSVASYGRIATAVCGPDAARAVGTACGANPIAYLIPCHRVIRETGIVQGYRWGEARKRALLAREGACQA